MNWKSLMLGRIGRRTFVCWFLLFYAAGILSGVAVFVSLATVFEISLEIAPLPGSPWKELLFLPFLLWTIALLNAWLGSLLILVVLRIHDSDMAARWLFIFLPILAAAAVNHHPSGMPLTFSVLMFILAFAFVSGTPEENRYGQPQKATRFESVMAPLLSGGIALYVMVRLYMA